MSLEGGLAVLNSGSNDRTSLNSVVVPIGNSMSNSDRGDMLQSNDGFEAFDTSNDGENSVPPITSLKSILRRQDNRPENQGTLISRQWQYVMPCSLLAYGILQLIISTQKTVCDVHLPFANWTYQVGIAVSACFGLSTCYHVANGFAVESWAQKETEHLRGVYAGAATMSVIAGSSTVLYLTRFGEHICRDALGMDTPNCQWPEWLIAAPLLVYITIAIEDKSELTVEDFAIIILMFLCILIGFVMNFFVDLVWGIILFILSTLCMVGNIVLALKAKENTVNHGNSKLLSHQWVLERMIMKSKLAQLLFWLLPLFPIIYIIGLPSIYYLDRDEVVVANMLIGLTVKLFFVSTLSLESVVMQFAAERKVNDRRRQFLRYVFHEVRVPLNTISMGIAVLKDDIGVLCEPNQEVLTMMDSAAKFMSNTLNDVLSMSKIEDGSITLVIKAFTLISLLETAMRAVRTPASAKSVRIVVKGLSPNDEARGLTVLGDETRLQHVLVNFLSNAVKFSIAGGVVTIEVGSAVKHVPRKLSDMSAKWRRPSRGGKQFSSFRKASRISASPSRDRSGNRDTHIRFVTIVVTDLGIGIPEDDHGKLFQAFAQIRPHDLEGMGGRGSGLGLVMAKEIITLHRGEVLFKSELGVGSSFGFTIPFPVVELNTPSANHSVHNISGAASTQVGRIKTRLQLPNLSIRMLPIKNRLVNGFRSPSHPPSRSTSGHISGTGTSPALSLRRFASMHLDNSTRDSYRGRNGSKGSLGSRGSNGIATNRKMSEHERESPTTMLICTGFQSEPGGTKKFTDIDLEHEEQEQQQDSDENSRQRQEQLLEQELRDEGQDLSCSLSPCNGSMVSLAALSEIGINDEALHRAATSNLNAQRHSIPPRNQISPLASRMTPLDIANRSVPQSRSHSPIKSTASVDTISNSRSVFGGYTERKMTFLLVDDTASNSKMLKMLLNKKGIECDLASNGLEAVTAYKAAFGDTGARRAAMYEVIFMDYTMPIMNGFEATTIIRSLGFTGLIVGVTGNALDDDVANFIKAGADCVFAKPFREEHLAALLLFIQENGCESSVKSQMLMRPEQRTYFR